MTMAPGCGDSAASLCEVCGGDERIITRMTADRRVLGRICALCEWRRTKPFRKPVWLARSD